MANAEIEVNFHGGKDDIDTKYYQPGAELRGTATIIPDGDVNCDHLYVRLEWHTEGRGTHYLEQVEELDLFQGELRGGFPRSIDFHFTLPASPWSYEGHYVSIVWRISVQIDVPWARDPQQSAPFVMLPNDSNQ